MVQQLTQKIVIRVQIKKFNNKKMNLKKQQRDLFLIILKKTQELLIKLQHQSLKNFLNEKERLICSLCILHIKK